jgi:LacI family transcriptional regulator
LGKEDVVANLKSLAEHLGLSQATVSRALNNYSTVNQETRDRVLEAAKKLNYRPNSSARRLATGRADAIGIVLPQQDNLLVDPHFADFLAALTKELAHFEKDVVLTATDSAQTYQRFAEIGKVDGFVISAPKAHDERIAVLSKLNFPFIVHGRCETDLPYGFYDIDNEGAFYDATKLLLQLGHTRIGLLNGAPDLMFAKQRFRGYQRAMAEFGLTLDPELIHQSLMTEEYGYRHAERLLNLTDRPTAFLCSSTLVTLGAQRRIREMGLEIGNDISIITHDDGLSSLKTENFSVALTVTRAPIRDAGTEIAKMMVSHIRGTPIEDLQKIVPVDLIVRTSTSAPKRS